MVGMHKAYKHYTFLVLHVIAILQTCLPLRILAASSQERQDAIDVLMIGTSRGHNVSMKEVNVVCHFVAEGLAQFQQSFRGTVHVQIVNKAAVFVIVVTVSSCCCGERLD